MANKESDIHARLRALRESYAAQLPGKLGEIEQQWEALTTGDWSLDTVEVLHRLTHTLAGSGGTFGFTRLGERARAIEQVLKKCLEEKSQAFEDPQRARIQEMLSELREAASESPLEIGNLPVFAKGRDEEERRNDTTEQRLIYLSADDAALADELVLQLGHFGYQVRVFHGSEALKAALDSERPAAVIMDIALPGGPAAGVESICHIETGDPEPLPVVFISSRGDLQARLAAVRAGVDAYFVKPVDIDALIDRLDQLTEPEQPEPYRILIVEDDTTLAAHYELVLRQAGMDIETVTRPLEVMEALANVMPELILMDVYMPECSGLELAKLIRQQAAYVSIPIVFLSSESNLEKQFRALRMGGDDFLTKPIRDDHLLSSVAIRAERSRLINSLMAQDSLTGLLKHSKIKEQLAVEESRCKRSRSIFAFAMIDIDHFKAVNDNYGHMNGDRVIKSLSRLLQQRLRRSDSIGRYGGEEFAVILPDCDVASAIRLLEDIRTHFAGITHLHEGQAFSVTFSAGVAGFPHYENAAGLNQAADEALYDAKRLGRNRVVAAGEDDSPGA